MPWTNPLDPTRSRSATGPISFGVPSNLPNMTPAVSVAMSTDLLERVMEEAVVSRGIAKAGLRPEQYLALLSAKALLNMSNADFGKELIRCRNLAVHDASLGLDQGMAEEHARAVEQLIMQLNPDMGR